MNDLIRACVVAQRSRAFVRGVLYRALRRGQPLKLNDVTRRVLVRYPDDFDEPTAAQMVAEVARDYAARTRLHRYTDQTAPVGVRPPARA